MLNTLKTAFRSGKFLVGFIIISIILLTVIIYPLVSDVDPMMMSGMMFEKPGSEHVLGTDNFGRDVLSELIHGARTSLFIGVMAGVIATAIGLVIGLLAGYVGRMADNVLSSITNVFIVIPSFIVLRPCSFNC